MRSNLYLERALHDNASVTIQQSTLMTLVRTESPQSNASVSPSHVFRHLHVVPEGTPSRRGPAMFVVVLMNKECPPLRFWVACLLGICVLMFAAVCAWPTCDNDSYGCLGVWMFGSWDPPSWLQTVGLVVFWVPTIE